MRFCPRCRSMLVPVKKGDKQVLRCTRCGYEEEVTDKTRSGYVTRREIAEEKHTGVAISSESERGMTSEERELLEDYHKQLLENLYETERESEED
ncbi:MAG: DNA-directed RNA polymerase [Crenarchaeota archaeon]|nr:DNA-directed RNA polymerase [Thermoproteota archaeon]